MRKNVRELSVEHCMGRAAEQHLDWLARSFGRADYRPLAHADFVAIQGVAELLEARPGVHLFRAGEEADAAIVIESGEVETSRGEGRNRRRMGRLGPGAVLGDLAMFQGRVHFTDAKVVRELRGYRFSRSRVLPELAAHPGIMLRWLLAMTRRIETTQLRLVELMHKTVLAQVADLLAEESGMAGEVLLSQSTIGTLLGVSRQSVNEALGRLRDQGVVETGYRHIEILDPDRLARIAEV
jgi:CRP/FNR family transcriptional regulator, cAMP and macrophage regulator